MWCYRITARQYADVSCHPMLEPAGCQVVIWLRQSPRAVRKLCRDGTRTVRIPEMLAEKKASQQEEQKIFPHRDSNPGLLGESQLS